MNIFSLDEQVVVEAVSSVTPSVAEVVETVPVAERFARASWSGLAEPGDSLAGLLVKVLGASEALSSLVAHRSGAKVREALLATGIDAPSVKDMESGLARWRPRLASLSALTAMRQAARCGARLLVPGDAEWPVGFNDLGLHAPLALWARGRPKALDSLNRCVAVVGARAATGYGDHMAMEIAAGLVDLGYGVVSGGAYGIDGMAHRSALASSGQTAAFLAGGVDRFYPAGHDALLTRIANVGVVLSELPCGSAPTKWRFLQRNRLIAAVSLATVVVEAGIRSGSLNTAAHAASIGRPIGAVPGPVTSMASAGCHRLLREFDAVCVTSAEEVVELVADVPRHIPVLELENRSAGVVTRGRDGGAAQSADHAHRPAEQLRVMDALSRRSARATDDIARRCGVSVAAAQAALGALGLEGVAEEVNGGWKSRPQA